MWRRLEFCPLMVGAAWAARCWWSPIHFDECATLLALIIRIADRAEIVPFVVSTYRAVGSGWSSGRLDENLTFFALIVVHIVFVFRNRLQCESIARVAHRAIICKLHFCSQANRRDIRAQYVFWLLVLSK
jgi:hypothetical protein